MGMFDSLYDADGHEWQTKAYDCLLDLFRIGETMPPIHGTSLRDYQVEVLGGPNNVDAYATVRAGALADVPAVRYRSLPLFNYSGHLIQLGDADAPREEQIEAAEDRADQVAYDAHRERS